MGSVEPVYRNRDRGKPGNLRGRRLTGAGTRGLSFLQKATGLRDEFCHFEGLYQAGDAVFLQVGASITRFHSVGEGEQDVAFHSGAIFSEPLVGFFGGPLARHVAVHDEGVKRFREQASLHILGGPRGHDRGACPRRRPRPFVPPPCWGGPAFGVSASPRAVTTAGNRTSMTAPPSGALLAVMSPPCSFTIP